MEEDIFFTDVLTMSAIEGRGVFLLILIKENICGK